MKILELPTTLMDISKLDNIMAQMLMETVNNMLIELYAAMAQAEIEKKEKRQREGIEAKKVRGDCGKLRRIFFTIATSMRIHRLKLQVVFRTNKAAESITGRGSLSSDELHIHGTRSF